MNKQKSIKYVALLRGIAPTNPNMRNDKLREVFEKPGFKNVQTVISSGNEKQFGKEITTRTWKTVHRILNKMNQ